MTYCRLLSQHLLDGTEEIHRKPHTDRQSSGLESNQEPPKYEVISTWQHTHAF